MPKKLHLIGGSPPPDAPATPSDLGPDGAAFWRAVQAEYVIIDAGGISLLQQCCRAIDRAERCRIQVDAEGETIKSKSGLREHPLLKIEAINRALAARLIRALGLDVEPIRSSVGKPPGSFGRG